MIRIENSTLKIGGNDALIWLGKKIAKWSVDLQSWGEKMEARNRPTLVTNPVAFLYNPFTLIVAFTVDTNDKYQVILQGDYKQKYKDCENGNIIIAEEDLFMIINQSRKLWFKKY